MSPNYNITIGERRERSVFAPPVWDDLHRILQQWEFRGLLDAQNKCLHSGERGKEQDR